MAILDAEIKWYLSKVGGGAQGDPDDSFGGAISTTEWTSGLNSLFDDLSGAETTAGDNNYRCVYIKNTNGTTTWTDPKVFISSNTPNTESNIRIGLGSSGVDGTEQRPASESTAPSAVTFADTYTSYANGLALGFDLAAGEYFPIWIHRDQDAASGAYSADTFTIEGEGDSVA